MSGRVRKQSDCPAGKQGPMRATLPVSSIMKQTGLRNSCGNSPTLSPTNVWRHISPENHPLSGQRSPGALNYKGRSRFGSGNAIRRTASLDTLYQKGQWPRDFYLHGGLLQIDKASQTDDGNSGSTGNICGRTSSSSDDDRLEKYLRQRLQRTPNKAAHAQEHSSQTMSPVFGGVAGGWMRYAGSGGAPLRAARSSVEGLNQEIERLVLSSNVPHLDNRHKVTPEGHRAPLADMLRRSVNTQTPHELTYTHSSGCSSRESLSSGCSPERLMPGGSVCSSPDAEGGRLGTSPQINCFLAREPPHGCEKVKLKSNNEAFATYQLLTPSGDPAACPVVKPGGGFLLRPSIGSAFYPLQPPLPFSQPPHTHQDFEGEAPQARKALHFPPGYKPGDE